MDPQQEIFTELLIRLRQTNYDVHDGTIPPEGTPYPFIYLAENHQTDAQNKSAVFGTVRQTIHIWHNNTAERGTVSAVLYLVKSICRMIEETPNYNWYVSGIDQQIIPDDTTKQPLLHGVLDMEFRFS